MIETAWSAKANLRPPNNPMQHELIYRASIKKALLVLLGSVCFVAIGLWITTQMPVLGWLGVGFFALGVPASLFIMMRPNSTYLRLDQSGFEIVTVFRRLAITWSEVEPFHLVKVSGAPMIGIAYSPEYTKQRTGRAVASALSGVEGAIANQYSAPLEEICQTLNTWRERFGRTATYDGGGQAKEPPRLIPESLYVVQLSDTGVSCAHPEGKIETVEWDELQRVEVLTTDEGPFVPDVFWILHGSRSGCVIPQGATGERELLERLQAMPGFRNEAVIEAMSSAVNQRFLCWEKGVRA